MLFGTSYRLRKISEDVATLSKEGLSKLFRPEITDLSRPVSYLSFKTKSNDGAQHNVQLYFGASTDLAVNVPSQEVTAQQYISGDLSLLKAGTVEQHVLQKKR